MLPVAAGIVIYLFERKSSFGKINKAAKNAVIGTVRFCALLMVLLNGVCVFLSALAAVFPPYPERSEFDIFAQMHTDKEMGGDFYDFFFVGRE